MCVHYCGKVHARAGDDTSDDGHGQCSVCTLYTHIACINRLLQDWRPVESFVNAPRVCEVFKYFEPLQRVLEHPPHNLCTARAPFLATVGAVRTQFEDTLQRQQRCLVITAETSETVSLPAMVMSSGR